MFLFLQIAENYVNVMHIKLNVIKENINFVSSFIQGI